MSAPAAQVAMGDFNGLAGESFVLGAGRPAAVEVRLTEVRSLGFGMPAEQGGQESFSLLFHAPAGARVTQGIHEFTHPKLGTQSFFLVPLGPDARGMRLEVIFNFN